MGGFIVLLLIQHEDCIFFCAVLHCHVWPVRLYHIFLCRITLSCVASQALPHFSVLYYTVMCGLSGSTTFFCAVLHCHVWPVRLYHIFPHYIIKDTIKKNY